MGRIQLDQKFNDDISVLISQCLTPGATSPLEISGQILKCTVYRVKFSILAFNRQKTSSPRYNDDISLLILYYKYPPSGAVISFIFRMDRFENQRYQTSIQKWLAKTESRYLDLFMQ